MVCEPNPGHPRFPGRGARPDQLRRRVPLSRRVRQLGRGARARRDHPLLGEGARARGCRCAPISRDFWRDVEWMGLQRHLKVLGIFARLAPSRRQGGLRRGHAALRRLRAPRRRALRELAPLGALLDELEGRAPQVRLHVLMASALILAAGRGERLRPLTDTTPKPLLAAGGRALIEWQVERLVRGGFTDLVVNHSHLGAHDRGGAGRRRALRRAHPLFARVAGARDRGRHRAGAAAARATRPSLVVSGDIHTDFDYAHARARASRAIARDPARARRAFRAGRQSAVASAAATWASRTGASRATGPRLTYGNIAVFHPSLFARHRARHVAQALSLGLPLRRGGPRDRRALPRAVGQRRHARAARRARHGGSRNDALRSAAFPRRGSRRGSCAFMREHAFGTLVSSGDGGTAREPHPVRRRSRATTAMRLRGHVARANAQWEALEGAQHVHRDLPGAARLRLARRGTRRIRRCRRGITRWCTRTARRASWTRPSCTRSADASCRRPTRRATRQAVALSEQPRRLRRRRCSRMIVGFEIEVERARGQVQAVAEPSRRGRRA